MLWFKCNEIIPGVSIAVLFISVCLGLFLATFEFSTDINVEEACRMAEGQDNKAKTFREAGKTAFVLGYTGETGRRLIKELAKEKLFRKVVLIGRREVELSAEFGPEFEQKQIDFEQLDLYTDVFKGLDVGFCCLGTTKAAAGEKGFVRVDHDYVIHSAQLAKAGGTKHFQLMSTYGANHNSSTLYTRTKGQVEEALKVMHFDRLSIFRPAVLMVNRNESRPLEAIARFFLVPVAKLFPTAITIPVEVVVQAMINNAITPTEQTVEVFENKAIHLMSGISSVCPKETNKNK